MQRGRPKAQFGTQAVVVGAEDVVEQHFMQWDLQLSHSALHWSHLDIGEHIARAQ